MHYSSLPALTTVSHLSFEPISNRTAPWTRTPSTTTLIGSLSPTAIKIEPEISLYSPRRVPGQHLTERLDWPMMQSPESDSTQSPAKYSSGPKTPSKKSRTTRTSSREVTISDQRAHFSSSKRFGWSIAQADEPSPTITTATTTPCKRKRSSTSTSTSPSAEVGTASFPCLECTIKNGRELSFQYESALRYHNAVCHEPKIYSCPFAGCPIRFSRQHVRAEHIKCDHGVECRGLPTSELVNKGGMCA